MTKKKTTTKELANGATKKSEKKAVVKLEQKKKPTLEKRVLELEMKDNLSVVAIGRVWKHVDNLEESLAESNGEINDIFSDIDDIDVEIGAIKCDIEEITKELEVAEKNIIALGYGIIILVILFVISLIV